MRISAPHSSPFEFLKSNDWVFREKVDGTNIRVMWSSLLKGVAFGGKTDDAQLPVNLLYKSQQRFDGTVNKRKFEAIFPDTDVCLYGEGYGAKIQKGGGNNNQGRRRLRALRCENRRLVAPA